MRLKQRSSQIKSQDVLLLLKLLGSEKPESLRLVDLAMQLGISQSEISHGLVRLQNAKLVDNQRTPQKANTFEFIAHGLKYIFPASLGPIKRGIPTAHSAPPLSVRIVAGTEPYVWATESGEVRGTSIEPLYLSAPEAAQKDRALYELLSLIDAVRVGRAREQKMALDELRKRILNG